MELQTAHVFEKSQKMGMFYIGRQRPELFEAFLNLAHEVMHPESAFSPLIRELLGAYVSKRFGCSFCHLGHLETAFMLGGEEVRPWVDEPTESLRVLYALADKIIDNAVRPEDITDFLALGYSERHYEDIVFVCALFGFANRMVTGFGIEYDARRDEASSRMLAQGYRFKK